MNARNPYAPPTANVVEVGSTDCSRDGKNVIVHAGSDLPPRCIHCNAPVKLPIKPVKLYWHSPWLYLLFLVNVIIYLVVALLARNTVKVSPGLCEVHAAKRKNKILLFVGLGGACIVAGIVVLRATHGDLGILFFFLALIFLIVAGFSSRKLTAKKITKEYARLAGCKEPFLASLE